MVIFGGRTQEGRRLSDVWALETGAWAWRHVPTIGTTPSPRWGASAAVWGALLVVFGGTGTSSFYNDVWTLDLAQTDVRRPHAPTDPPNPKP